jgi:hypothetical protein
MRSKKSGKTRSSTAHLTFLFYPGIFCTAREQVTKYISSGCLSLPTGELVQCQGKNNLAPLDLISEAFLGEECSDVDTQPFVRKREYFNPLTLITTAISRIILSHQGIRVCLPGPIVKPSQFTYALKIENISVGQETDLITHKKNYQQWKNTHPTNPLALMGTSRGAVTTWRAYTEYKYPEVKLIILEGCFAALSDVFNAWVPNVSSFVEKSISFFTRYRPEERAPIDEVADFPEQTPVVFITSKADKIVPPESTERLAQALADRGKNPVYLLKLERASHPNYMFDDLDDRNNYEAFIHAIYKRYGFEYKAKLAKKGQVFLDTCRLVPQGKTSELRISR